MWRIRLAAAIFCTVLCWASGATSSSRDAIVAMSPRIVIDSPTLEGSVSLRGGRIDDVVLRGHWQPDDVRISGATLFSPSGAEHPYYAEFGWVANPKSAPNLPGKDAIWTQQGSNTLTPSDPVTLRWDNGEGLTFKRTISIDQHSMFSILDTVENHTNAAISLHFYGLISRHGMPSTRGLYVLFEGLIGVVGEAGLTEITYSDVVKEHGSKSYGGKGGGWVGMTDRNWAAALIPDQNEPFRASFSGLKRDGKHYFQVDYTMSPVTIAPGHIGTTGMKLFAGVKRTDIVAAYQERLGIRQFDLIVDWGWFWFITRPLFAMTLWLANALGDGGLAFAVLAVLAKLGTLPFSSWSYYRMTIDASGTSGMPEAASDARRERTLARCDSFARRISIGIQMLLTFALYKLLLTTVELQRLPFFGMTFDFSSLDPTKAFAPLQWMALEPSAFGILSPFLHLSAGGIAVGGLMAVQSVLAPRAADPTQRIVNHSVPVLAAYAMSHTPVGLVIYTAASVAFALCHQLAIVLIFRDWRRQEGLTVASTVPAHTNSELPRAGERQLPLGLSITRQVRGACQIIFWLSAVGLLVASRIPDGETAMLALASIVLIALLAYLTALSIGASIANRVFAAALSSDRGSRWRIVLFLRSFAIAKSSLTTRFFIELGYVARGFFFTSVSRLAGEPSSSFRDRYRFEAEERLGDAIGTRAMFVAIGDRLASYGAAKLRVPDSDWKQTFNALAESSELIFMMPGPSVALMWELSEILRDPNLIAKTIFVMPPERKPSATRNRVMWMHAGELAKVVGVVLPPYQPRGCYFRVDADGLVCETVGLHAFTIALPAYLDRRSGSDPVRLTSIVNSL